jgi:hypothetical protein
MEQAKASDAATQRCSKCKCNRPRGCFAGANGKSYQTCERCRKIGAEHKRRSVARRKDKEQAEQHAPPAPVLPRPAAAIPQVTAVSKAYRIRNDIADLSRGCGGPLPDDVVDGMLARICPEAVPGASTR